MLRHKVTATNIQRVKLQEISSSMPTDSHKDIHHNNNNRQEEPRRANTGARTQSVAATTVGVDQFDDENDSDFNFFDESTNNANPNSRSQSRHNANKNAVVGGENDPNKTHKGPRSFECEVRGAMVSRSCVPGDIVNIVGIVKTISVRNCLLYICMFARVYSQLITSYIYPVCMNMLRILTNFMTFFVCLCSKRTSELEPEKKWEFTTYTSTSTRSHLAPPLVRYSHTVRLRVLVKQARLDFPQKPQYPPLILPIQVNEIRMPPRMRLYS